MVILLYFLFFMGTASLNAQEPRITASIDSDKAFENYPLTGLITITHDPKDKIDPSSVILDNKPLNIEFQKKVVLADDLVFSIYKFSLSAQSKGLHALPAISVKIGNNEYHSIPTTYEVKAFTSQNIKKSSQPAALQLKPILEVPQPLFPGEELELGYYFYFKGNIALTKENLPLLSPEGFEKIGDKKVNEYEQNGWHVQEIRQRFKALSPGQKNIPESLIEGYEYEENLVTKTKNYIEPLITAKAQPIEILVGNLPENKPVAFQGAVGQFDLHVSVEGDKEVIVENPLQLTIQISAEKADSLATVTAPELKNLELTGLFRVDDFPVLSEVSGNTKKLVFQIYPLFTTIKEIPSIEFSFFDPQKRMYVTKKSEPISIVVKDIVTGAYEPVDVSEKPKVKLSNYRLSEMDLRNFASWNFFLIFPILIFLVFAQYVFKKFIYSKVRSRPSRINFDALTASSKDTSQFFSLLNKFMLDELLRLNLIDQIPQNIDSLSDQGSIGKVKKFMKNIEEQRFTGQEIEPSEYLTKTKNLIDELENSYV